MKHLILTLLTFASLPLYADIFDVPKVQSVFNRRYQVKDEITAQLVYLPKGAFSKYVGAGGVYTHAFSEFTSWEVVNAMYTYELPSGLKKTLISDYAQDPATFAVEYFQVTSNIIFTPIYTKNLFFNSSIVYSQFSVVVGAGIGYFNVGVVPVIDSGFVLRFFLPNTKNFIKFDLRYNKFLTTNQTVNDSYTVVFGYAFNLTRKGEAGD